MGEEAMEAAIKLAARLRQANVSTIVGVGNKSLKAQMRQANSLGVRWTVIIGEQEIKTGSVILRDMTNAQQKTIPINALPELLK